MPDDWQVCPDLLGSRDGRTTIVPRLGGEPTLFVKWTTSPQK